MKTLFFILFAVLVSTCLMAGNLEFNQIKLVTAQETVPAGKVWKVVSVIYDVPANLPTLATSTSTSNCNYDKYQSYAVVVDGVPTKVGTGGQPNAYSSASYFQSFTMLPLWLPAGATLNGGPCNNKVSVIEFNVVP